MLYIINGTLPNPAGVPTPTWHIGERLPLVTGRVVTFQADGDELDIILSALQNASQGRPTEETHHPH